MSIHRTLGGFSNQEMALLRQLRHVAEEYNGMDAKDAEKLTALMMHFLCGETEMSGCRILETMCGMLPG